MKRFLLLFLMPMIVSNSFAEDLSKEIATCASMPGDLVRLECFDTLAKRHKLDSPQPHVAPVRGSGKWDVSDTINPIDDSRTVTLALKADSGQSRWGEPITLILRCKSNKTELYIAWNNYLGSEASVLTRIGKSRAVTKGWGLSTDSQASFYPGSPITFIKEMFGADQLVAQVTPYSESPVTAMFDIRGLESAASPLMETCGW